ncbi:hypothetical protein V2J09_001152 [Rumex salicifolius]
MTIQDHSNCPDYSTLLPGGHRILLDAAAQTMGEGHVTKIRKQYTISKQRERWTEEEHKKFLEALKLYGRAWRKIEEHVGTKTAVQIRSHAQKFFSKVVRESKNSDSSSTKVMEIPPPRPKRKPMHPYPRKLVIPVIKDMNFQQQSVRSTSPNSSVDQENQSPTSVLSAFASENGQFEDSSTPEGSSSLMSACQDIVNQHDDPILQDHISQLDVEPVSVKLELSPTIGAFRKESSPESTSPKFLKLFGKTMLLEDPEMTATKLTGPSAPVPSRAFCGGLPLPFIQLHCINFTAGSVNVPDNCQMDRITRTQINECFLESTRIQQSQNSVFQPKYSSNFRRASSDKYSRAFVPYKRSLSEKCSQSSAMNGTVLLEAQQSANMAEQSTVKLQ